MKTTSLSIQDINSAIISGGFTNDNLNSIIQAITFARTRLAQKTKASLHLGDNVQFTNSRNGNVTTGNVIKIAVKYVTVQTIDGRWKVPASMLSKIDAVLK
jgi:hypothetical protein